MPFTKETRGENCGDQHEDYIREPKCSLFGPKESAPRPRKRRTEDDPNKGSRTHGGLESRGVGRVLLRERILAAGSPPCGSGATLWKGVSRCRRGKSKTGRPEVA